MEDKEKEQWGSVAVWVVVVIILAIALFANL